MLLLPSKDAGGAVSVGEGLHSDIRGAIRIDVHVHAHAIRSSTLARTLTR